MNCDVKGMTEIERRLLDALKDIEYMSVTEWAEKYISLYDPHHQLSGPVDFTRYPFIKEPLESMCDPGVKMTVLCFSAQMLKTTALNLAVAYGVAQSRMTQLWAMDSEDNCRRFSETRWQPFIDQNKCLRDLLPQDEDKYKILDQEFITGIVRFVGAASLGKLASTPAGKVVMDETENYKLKDAVYRLIERLAGAVNGQAIMTSTPLYSDGPIWQAYIRRTMHLYFVPCPHCGKFITFEFANLKWDKRYKRDDGTWDVAGAAKTAHIECPECGGHIHDDDKPAMCRAGEWRATNPAPTEVGNSYRINRLYSILPSGSFAEICRMHLVAGKDPAARQNFSNSVLAEPYEEPVETTNDLDVLARICDYPADGTIPRGVLMLTCGVDVQRGKQNDPEKPPRLEAEIVGWGVGEEQWGIEKKVFACSALSSNGSGSITDTGPDGPWAKLREWLMRTRRTEDGRTLTPVCTFVDSGYIPQTVYQFCEENQPLRIEACKGKTPGQPGDPIVTIPTKRNIQRVPLYFVSRYSGNMYVYAHIKATDGQTGAMHFPRDPSTGYDYKYFQQLTAEKLVRRLRAGRQVEEWIDSGNSTEALAMRRYAVAAFFRMNADLDAMARKVESLRSTPAPPTTSKLTIAQRRMQNAKMQSNSSWATNW